MNSWSLATYFPQRLNGKFGSGCSGTIISRDAVLTAAHCVHRYGAWKYDFDFSPAQFRDYADGLVKTPYGTYNWKHVTTYSEWTGNYYPKRKFPKYGVDIGSRLGYAGLRYTKDDSSHLDRSYNTGYPGDKGGEEMWKSYCGDVFDHHHWYDTISKYLVEHGCDSVPGNSGGSLISYDGYVHGIQVAGPDGSENIALLLRDMHYDNSLKWSGRA